MASILATGTFDVRSHPRVQVLIDGLREHGWDVEEIVEPLRLSTAQRVDVLRHPSRLPQLATAVLRSWVHLLPRLRRRRRLPPPTGVLVGYLGHFDVPVVRRLTRPAPVVLDFLISGAATAVDRGEGGRLKQSVLRRLDDLALRSADVILVDTEEHAEALPAVHRDRAVVVPVGAERRWFAARPASRPDEAAARMSVVFFGLLTPLQGAPVVASALAALDGLVDATFIGTGQDEAVVDRLLAGVPGVVRSSWVDPEMLPGLVARHDVCLGIFGTGDKAHRVVPNKVYQGMAAGCAIVTGDTRAQRRVLGDSVVYVPPGDATALAAAIRDLASSPARRMALADAALARAREAFTPAAVVRPLVRALERSA
jgi:glycosyltransferase involved in cell wall biosynthesis